MDPGGGETWCAEDVGVDLVAEFGREGEEMKRSLWVVRGVGVHAVRAWGFCVRKRFSFLW